MEISDFAKYFDEITIAHCDQDKEFDSISVLMCSLYIFTIE